MRTMAESRILLDQANDLVYIDEYQGVYIISAYWEVRTTYNTNESLDLLASMCTHSLLRRVA